MSPRARKPAPPKPAPPKKDPTERSIIWKYARIDLPCGHSVTRTPELSRVPPEQIYCDPCEFKKGRR
jgi:hypothetical protein